MKVKIVSEKENPLLKRREIRFHVEHNQTGATPQRLEVRREVAAALKADADLVFIKNLETRTGTHEALGTANVYNSSQQANLIEPQHILKRNMPPQKQEEKE